MAGTKEGALKGKETRLSRDPNVYSKMGKKDAGKAAPTRGFGSEKIGKDGLTGAQRAKLAGKRGGKSGKKG